MMSMAEYILKLRGHIKKVLRRKQELRIIAYGLYQPKEPMSTWMPNPLDRLDSGVTSDEDMLATWQKALKRHDERAQSKD